MCLTRYHLILGVLILVLMEDTLRDLMKNGAKSVKSLNPCFNGRYSQSITNVLAARSGNQVLILVLMEDTLREHCRWKNGC